MVTEFASSPRPTWGWCKRTARWNSTRHAADGGCGRHAVGGVRSRNYLDYIGEHVNAYTYLKAPFYKKRGYENGIYRVGPLGRLNAASHISTPMAQGEMKIWKSLNGGKPVEGTLYFHYARLIETLYALERVRELMDDPEIMGTDVVNPQGEITGEGVGVLKRRAARSSTTTGPTRWA
jgi:coenzyme F420-reducing hydrogenase alpha subunit